MKQTLSVVISAYNEEKSLGRCLDSVSFADEIIVVDNTSTDKTAQIARTHKASVYTKPNQLMLNKNKNFGFEKATGDWILNLDADEEIPPDLAEEIRKTILRNPGDNGFWIKRKNISFGKWIRHGLWWPDKQIRLFRRGKGKFPCLHIHEYIAIEGLIGELTAPYIHYNYETIHQYLTKIDRASSSEALQLKAAQYQLAWYDAFRFPISDFLKIFFAQKGYKDGLHGLVLAGLQACYSFAVFAKIWELDQFPDKEIQPDHVISELRKRMKECDYWMHTILINESSGSLGSLWHRLVRKFHTVHA